MRLVCSFVVVLALSAAVLVGVALAQQVGAWFGAEVVDVTKAEADKLRWDAPHGAKVHRIEAGSPAETAGLKVGDIILTLDRTEIDGAADFNAGIDSKRPGTEVRLRVLSGRRELRIAAVLGEFPVRRAASRDTPILQLDTGGHMGHIRSLIFTPDGQHLVSASLDKVIRVWDWRTGTTVRSIRGQAGQGHAGKIYAMALSPDGRWLAVGGYLGTLLGTNPREEEEGTKIRLYEFATGRLVTLLKGHTNVVLGLAFAPDSKRLISGSGDRTAIIWDVERRALAHHLKGHTDQIYAVGFSPDGSRAVTGSFDKTLRLWSVSDGKQLATLYGHKDLIFVLAVSGAEGTIASGSRDGEIRLWDGRTGRFLRTLAGDGHVGALRFSPNGRQLLSSTCDANCADSKQRIWEVATGKELRSFGWLDNPVFAADLGPDGHLVAAGGSDNPEIHIWDAKTGQLEKQLVGKGATRYAAAFSADGRHLAWGNTWASDHSSSPQPLAWQLRLAQPGSVLGVPERVGSGAFVRARITHGAYALAFHKGGDYGHGDATLAVSRDGKVQASIARGATDGISHMAYTFAPDGQSIISGGNGGVLIAYDLQGKNLGEFVGHEGAVFAVTPSADGRLLVSGSADQTIRLWNLKTRELIVTLFHGTDGEWVMWTPQGYYTGSPGADKIVGWQINKGPDKEANYVGADQLRQHLHRPDIVDKAIILASAEQAVRESPGTSFRLTDLLAKPVPRFRIVSPAPNSTQRGGRVQIKIAIEAVPDPIWAMRVQVNGRQVSEITARTGSGGIQAGEHDLDVPLGKGRNEVRITLANATGDKTETLLLNHQADGDLDKRGTLHILAIGVERYPGLGNTCGPDGTKSCDLRFTGADARRLADAAAARLGPMHSKMMKRVLVNGAGDKDAPTAVNILDAMDLLRDTAESDTVLLFIAGHGVNEEASYRFLPTDVERAGSSYRGRTVVSWQLLQEAIESAKGRRILFVDTCHSGNAYNQKLGNAAYHANIIAYTSARFDQEALEDAQLGHGIFTYAVVEGLEGKGAMAAKGEITTRGLAEYVIRRVDQLAKDMRGEQEPQYLKGRDAEDYLLARQ